MLNFIRMAGIAFAGFALASAAVAEEWAGEAPVHFFTHGDTRLAKLEPGGELRGKAVGLIGCMMTAVGVPYDLDIAPMSRSSRIIDSDSHNVWVPAAHDGDDSRLARMIGPFDTIPVYWYFRDGEMYDPSSKTFKTEALVTAYQGSHLEAYLLKNGYRFRQGSAHHAQLLYFLLNHDVDAILSVDFTHMLSTRQRAEALDRVNILHWGSRDVSMLASEGLYRDRPELVDDMRVALAGCSAG